MKEFDFLNQRFMLKPLNVEPKCHTIHLKTKRSKSELQDYQLTQSFDQERNRDIIKAIHRPTGEEVAVKILKIDNFDSEQISAIQENISLQQKLMHQHIAQIYEVVRKGNKIYIFMEYCSNGQLFDFLVKNGPLKESEAVRLFHQILQALLYLKKLGINHKNIKPGNIMLDQEKNIKLVDFEFNCRALSKEQAFRKTVCATPFNTSPEILLKKDSSAELMVVWSLGVALYAMLSGELPFQSKSSEKRRAKIINCKWLSKPCFSSKVAKLISSMLVQSTWRASLTELQSSDLLMSYQFNSAQFIDYNNQMIVLQESVLNSVGKYQKIDRKRVEESVQEYKLDRYHASYYLTLRKERKNNGGVQISRFTKQRKCLEVNIQPIMKISLQNRRKENPEKSLKIDTDSGRCRSLHTQQQVQLKNSRLRREVASESPRKLFDCLASYKGE